METSRVGEILGVWRLGQLLGSGGMGDVYLAERIDGVVRQRAAIKILVPRRIRSVFPACRMIAEPAVLNRRRFGNLVLAGRDCATSAVLAEL